MNSQWEYLMINQYQATLTVQDEHGKLVPIPRLEMSKAQWTLGVQIALDGNNNVEAMYLIKVAKE